MGKSKGGANKTTFQPAPSTSLSSRATTTTTTTKKKKKKRSFPHRTDGGGAGEDGPSLTPSARSTTKPHPASTTSTNNASSLPLPFPSHLPRPPNHDFLVAQPPYQESFQVALETSYEGFVVDEHFHQHHETTTLKQKQQQKQGGGGGRITEYQMQTCLEQMQTQRFFQKDITQPFGLGTKCAPTYVTRCLVGNPGTTYKYLGLRMFAHNWWNNSTPTSCVENTGSKFGGGDEPLQGPPTLATTTTKTCEMTKQIHDLSVCLSNATKEHLCTLDMKRKLRGAVPTQGRATFDICLINRMDPKEQLKAFTEPSSQLLPHLGTSVSWHADSSLEHFSTIAVYQTLLGENGLTSNRSSLTSSWLSDHPWYVAMRVAPHCEGPTASHQRKRSIQSTVDVSIPPIAARLPSGSVYYLLDDFNHHHQHTVLRRDSQNDRSATSTSTSTPTKPAEPIRYSCTFRLLRDSHTIQYMIQRCQSAVSNFHKKGLKVWRSEQLLLFDVESEWIRQFFIQGSHHYGLLWESYWKDPFTILLKHWSQLEERTHQIVQWLELAARGKCSSIRQQSENDSQHILKIPPSKVERKSKEKEKKAWTTMQGLLDRGGPEEQGLDDNVLYETMAEFLKERATMRELWAKRERDHAFTELALELRPLAVPFQFVDEVGEIATPKSHFLGMARTDVIARSPLPGHPSKLREIASAVRAMGVAFVSGRPSDLPEMTFTAKATTDDNTPNEKSRPQNDQHSKSLIWSGWGQAGTAFGLELQAPWAGAILDGRKGIETRSYGLPPALIGKRIWILESPSGKAGVSAIGNFIDFQDTNDLSCKIAGWCRFVSCIQYTSREQFEADEKRHLVASNSSGYSWKEGRTSVIYGWVVSDHVRVETTSFVLAVRRMRSLFELKLQQQQHQATGKRKTGSGSGSSSSSKPREFKGQPSTKKRKRY